MVIAQGQLPALKNNPQQYFHGFCHKGSLFFRTFLGIHEIRIKGKAHADRCFRQVKEGLMKTAYALIFPLYFHPSVFYNCFQDGFLTFPALPGNSLSPVVPFRNAGKPGKGLQYTFRATGQVTETSVFFQVSAVFFLRKEIPFPVVFFIVVPLGCFCQQLPEDFLFFLPFLFRIHRKLIHTFRAFPCSLIIFLFHNSFRDCPPAFHVDRQLLRRSLRF